jgi:hypothetical protein
VKETNKEKDKLLKASPNQALLPARIKVFPRGKLTIML